MKKVYVLEEVEILQLKEMLSAECEHKFILDKLNAMIAGEEIRIPVECILQHVSNSFQINSEDILQKKRDNGIGWARKTTMYFLHEKQYTIHEIADLLKLKDPSMVMHGIHKVRERIKEGGEFADRIRKLELAMCLGCA